MPPRARDRQPRAQRAAAPRRRNNGGGRANQELVISSRPPGRGQLPGSFPERAMAPLEYTGVGRVSAGVITYGDQIWRINSLYDPDHTGGGHQPREYDTWGVIYGRYRVYKVVVDITVRQRASHGVEVYLIPTNEPDAITPADFPGELPRAMFLGITASNQPVVRFRTTLLPHQIMGLTAAQYASNENSISQFTTSPSAPAYLHLFVNQLDGATVGDFEYSVRFTFTAEFSDRKVIAPSALAAMHLAALHRRLLHPGSPVSFLEGDEPEQEAPAPSAASAAAAAASRPSRGPSPARSASSDAGFLRRAFAGSSRADR